MSPTHAAAARPVASSRRGRALHRLARALSPTYGSRCNAAEALQVLGATAHERRAVALGSTDDAAEGGRPAAPAEHATGGQQR